MERVKPGLFERMVNGIGALIKGLMVVLATLSVVVVAVGSAVLPPVVLVLAAIWLFNHL
jgi:hypothetical protein